MRVGVVTYQMAGLVPGRQELFPCVVLEVTANHEEGGLN